MDGERQVKVLPARTLTAAVRIILRTGCRPHEILTAELAWVQSAVLLSPDFDLATLAEPEAYTCLAPQIERPRGKGDRHESDKNRSGRHRRTPARASRGTL